MCDGVPAGEVVQDLCCAEQASAGDQMFWRGDVTMKSSNQSLARKVTSNVPDECEGWAPVRYDDDDRRHEIRRADKGDEGQ